MLLNRSGASPSRDGLEEDVIATSHMITKSALAQILFDAFDVVIQDIGSGTAIFAPPLHSMGQLLFGAVPSIDEELG